MSTQLRIAVRGKYTFGPAWIRLHGRWKLLEAQKAVDTTQAVQMYPESLLCEEELAKDAADELRLLDQLRSSRHRGVGTEFESLEEFRDGDDPRRIDRRTTARDRRPIVRRYQIERHRDLIVLLDCGRLMGTDARKGTKLDCAVDAALRLVRLAPAVAIAADSACSTTGCSDTYGRSVARDRADLSGQSIRRQIAPARAPFRRHVRHSSISPAQAGAVVVLSDVVDANGLLPRIAIEKLTYRHVVLFAALQTPLVRGH